MEGGQERQDWHAAIYIWIIGGILQTSLESKFGKGRIKWESKSLSIQLPLVSCSVDPYFRIAGGVGSHLRQERERERGCRGNLVTTCSVYKAREGEREGGRDRRHLVQHVEFPYLATNTWSSLTWQHIVFEKYIEPPSAWSQGWTV